MMPLYLRLFGYRAPVWRFVALGRLAGHNRAMLTTVWFLIGEKWK